MIRVIRVLLLSMLLSSPLTQAQTAADIGTDVTFTLTSGETFTAQVIESNLYTVKVAHPLLGELTIARASISEPAQIGGVAPAADEDADPETADAPAAAAPDDDDDERKWSGAIDLAANGTGGNSDAESVRTSFSLRGEDERAIDTLEIVYRWGKSQPSDASKSTTNTNNKVIRGRHEWLLQESKWRPFVQASYETDEFTDYDSRTAVAAGVGYPVIDEEKESLLFRAGVGAAKTSGSDDDNSWNAEALVGGDYRKDINDASRFEATVEVYPNLEEKGYRGIANAHYITAINPDGEGNPWNLKLGVENKYDSEPGTARAWDYSWYMGLSYVF